MKKKEIVGAPKGQKTKEQIMAELKNNAEFQQKMAFVKQVFYPALCRASTSIEDAQMLLHGFNTNIMQEFLGLMKEKKISDLNLSVRLDTTNEKHPDFLALLDLFKDQSVFEAKEHIEGMTQEINLFLQEERKTKKLEDLKTKWVDEL